MVNKYAGTILKNFETSNESSIGNFIPRTHKMQDFDVLFY